MDMPIGPLPVPDTLSQADLMLQQIADALGLPVAALKDPKRLKQEAGGAELLRLWLAIKSEQGRDAATAGLKAIMEAQTD